MTTSAEIIAAGIAVASISASVSPIATAAEMAVIIEARSWIETPWQHQGRLKGIAADCAGVVMCVGQVCGYVDPALRLTAYSRQPDTIKMKAALRTFLVPVRKSEIRPASIVWLRVVDDVGQHLGIYTERHTIIHASNDDFVIETPVEDAMRRQKLISVYRYRGIDG